MDLRLVRKEYRSDGIFSELFDTEGHLIAHTLEHAYEDLTGFRKDYLPKLTAGTYKCVKGKHRLHGMTSDFETFEITGVLGHSNILFHQGNYTKDSKGCVLLGQKVTQLQGQDKMITNSRFTFNEFMNLQSGVDEFTLVVDA